MTYTKQSIVDRLDANDYSNFLSYGDPSHITSKEQSNKDSSPLHNDLERRADLLLLGWA